METTVSNQKFLSILTDIQIKTNNFQISYEPCLFKSYHMYHYMSTDRAWAINLISHIIK